MTALEHVRAPEVVVTRVTPSAEGPGSLVDLTISITTGGRSVLFAVEFRRRAPFPNELVNLNGVRQSLENAGRPLLVAPYVTEDLGNALFEAGWSWADEQGNYDIHAVGLRLRQRRTNAAPLRTHRAMPTGNGSLSVIRTLISTPDADEPVSTTAIAARAGVSNVRASQVLSSLASLDLVERIERGKWRPNRSELLDQFLVEYRGPVGAERYLYSLDSPNAVTKQAARYAPPGTFAVSADVAPDLITPWRRPTVVILYVTSEFPSMELGLVAAHGRSDANVIIRSATDRSIISPHVHPVRVDDVVIPVADPSQVIWDLMDLGGADRLEAAGLVREWLLTNR